MKNSLLIAAAIAAATSLSACSDAKRAEVFSLGSKFQVTLYSANGGVIKTWTSQGKVLPEDHSDGWMFTDQDGKFQRISGTVVISQL
jgi:hypothetical protein